MDQCNEDDLEDIDNDTLNELVLGTLGEEALPAQISEGECNNLSEEIPEIAPRTTDAHEGNNNEVELNEEEIVLRLSKFPEIKMRSEINFNNLNEVERNGFEADTLHSKSFYSGMVRVAAKFFCVDKFQGS